MTLKPWREIITPHKDVLEGSFKQSEFAADLTQVALGQAAPEYGDPEKFFARTFITEGMRLLLSSVAQRLSGKGGDPVIQLQTSFGGGKTHTLLAVYHLAKRQVATRNLSGIPSILARAGIADLPKARVAVLDGIRMSPSQPRKYGATIVNTLWGELAWQLGGATGFSKVEASDRDGTSPGKETLAELLRSAGPCVILVDELVAFIRQLESGRTYAAGTFASNLSFVQALTEAVKLVPSSILLASLPESEIEAGGSSGKLALDSLQKYFARIESVWKPVATEEAFEIVKRRLFDGPGNTAEIEKVCRVFFDYYVSNRAKFPSETQAAHYLQRLVQSYPIHPEVFDRLYEDWSTLEKFQRTRGVLQYLAIVIHRLWNSENRDPLILPGSIPLDDVNVRTKSIHYLSQGWEPVIEGEIDGTKSVAAEIDAREPKFGAVQAARRVARAIFLGSAPRHLAQRTKGLPIERVLLGVSQPGHIVGVYEDALKRSLDKLQYLFSDNERFWFDTRPNLRREMEARKRRFQYLEHILPCIKDKLSRALRGNSCFAGIHVFARSADIPDEVAAGPRLVVMEPDATAAYSKANSESVFSIAEKLLRERGGQPRQRQNRLIFLAADYESASRLRENAAIYLAWSSIVEDIETERINLDTYQKRQALHALESAEKTLVQSVRETYKWLLNPFEDVEEGNHELVWEPASLSSTSSALLPTIESRLREEGWVVFEWSPIHLSNALKQWYFKGGTQEIVTRKLFNDFACYLYLPRLLNEDVLKAAIVQGVLSEDFYGYAQGRNGEHYLGLLFGSSGQVRVDEASLLLHRDLAAAQLKNARSQTEVRLEPVTGIRGQRNESSAPDARTDHALDRATRFFATKELNAQRARLDFGQLLDEVLIQLAARSSTFVSITVEIQAKDDSGFDDDVQRMLKENCKTLGFKLFDFTSD
jgi:predicted AAA+ superfamily ATPase